MPTILPEDEGITRIMIKIHIDPDKQEFKEPVGFCQELCNYIARHKIVC